MKVVTLPGDGIGREIIPPAVHLIELLAAKLGGFTVDVEERLDMGALYFRDSGGVDMSPGAFAAAKSADAILMGAMGWRAIRHHDGTEISPHLRLLSGRAGSG